MSQPNLVERSWSGRRRNQNRKNQAQVDALFFRFNPAFSLAFLISVKPPLLVLYKWQWANRLAYFHVGLARRAAHDYKQSCPEEYSDLENLAYEGLVRAAHRFDPRRGNEYSSYAMPFAKGAIQHFLRSNWGCDAKVPRRVFESVGAVRKAHGAIPADLLAQREQMGLATDEAVVARSYGMDDRAWQASIDACKRRPLMSYESLELIIAEDEVEPDRNYLAVRQAVARLPMPDRQIVTKAWMHGFTVARIAKEHRLTEAQVQAVLDARRPVLIQKLSHLV